MHKMTLSKAKNAMARALRDLVDPVASPSQQACIRAHFENRCAYCEQPAEGRAAHLDHAEPSGGNSIGNLVLACGSCNGDEKREAHWDEFLVAKCAGNESALARRRKKIQAWIDANPQGPVAHPPEVAAALAEAADAIVRYEAAYNKVRNTLPKTSR